MAAHFFVYITFPNMDEARIMGRRLVESGLAGCVNMFPAMESIYLWDGEVVSGQEVVLIAKTAGSHLEALVSEVKRSHSYSVPCIAALPVEHRNTDYADWLEQNLNRSE